jgi:hypothetical protein
VAIPGGCTRCVFAKGNRLVVRWQEDSGPDSTSIMSRIASEYGQAGVDLSYGPRRRIRAVPDPE